MNFIPSLTKAERLDRIYKNMRSEYQLYIKRYEFTMLPKLIRLAEEYDEKKMVGNKRTLVCRTSLQSNSERIAITGKEIQSLVPKQKINPSKTSQLSRPKLDTIRFETIQLPSKRTRMIRLHERSYVTTAISQDTPRDFVRSPTALRADIAEKRESTLNIVGVKLSPALETFAPDAAE